MVQSDLLNRLRRARTKLDEIDFSVDVGSRTDIGKIYDAYERAVEKRDRRETRKYGHKLEDAINPNRNFDGLVEKISSAQQIVYNAFSVRLSLAKVYGVSEKTAREALIAETISEKENKRKAVSDIREIDDFSGLLGNRVDLLRKACKGLINQLKYFFQLRMKIYEKAFSGRYKQGEWTGYYDAASRVFDNWFEPYTPHEIGGEEEAEKNPLIEIERILFNLSSLPDSQWNRDYEALIGFKDRLREERDALMNIGFQRLPVKLGFSGFIFPSSLREKVRSANENLRDDFVYAGKFYFGYIQRVLNSLKKFSEDFTTGAFGHEYSVHK